MHRLGVAAAALALGVVTACGGDASDDPTPEPTLTTPGLPDDVEITPPDVELEIGDAATLVMSTDDRTRSAVSVRLSRVRVGDIEDFVDFSLSEDLSDGTPYYVSVSLENQGPAGLGGSGVPLYLVGAEDGRLLGPNDVHGEFDPCGPRSLPTSFLPAESADVCLVYLTPAGVEPVGFEFVAYADERIRWVYEPPPPPGDDDEDADS